jgi:hypothetical protein
VAASPSAQQPPELRGTTPAPAWLRLRAGGGLNHDSSPLFTVGAEFRAAPWWNVGLDAALAVVPSRRSDRGYAFESSTHAFWLGSPFMVRPSARWSLSAGPMLGLNRQQVDVVDEALLPEGSPTRWIPAFGAQVGLRFHATRRVFLDLLQRTAWQVAGARFEIADGQGQREEVLELPRLGWDVSLLLGAAL